MKKNVVIFASGNGSNFVNIYKCINKGKINAKLVLLISNNPQCGAVIFAKKNGIDYKIINDYRYPIENNRNKQYELVLKYYKTDLILLAGFMKKIPQNIVKIYKILINKDSLPSFICNLVAFNATIKTIAIDICKISYFCHKKEILP